MPKLKLVPGIEAVETEKRNKALEELRNDISAKSWVTFKERLVFGYHFMSLNSPEEASKMVNTIPAQYWQTGIFMDLYRSVMAELMFKIEEHDFAREFEYFVVVKRMTVMMRELEGLTFKWEIYKFSDNFKSLSDFTSPSKG